MRFQTRVGAIDVDAWPEHPRTRWDIDMIGTVGFRLLSLAASAADYRQWHDMAEASATRGLLDDPDEEWGALTVPDPCGPRRLLGGGGGLVVAEGAPTGRSAGYIAGWIGGDVDRFKQLHERVGQVTRQLVPPDQLDQAIDAARTQASVQTSRRTTTAGRSR